MNSLPEIPYYAVIFTSIRKQNVTGYDETAERMERLGANYPGFLGIQSVRNAEGFGITVSYWKTLENISNWKNDLEHREAQQKGRNLWYSEYEVRICKVERHYNF
jgi:heme-degrading monooxygenase HmoA